MTDLYQLEHRERDEDPWDVLVGNLEVGEAQSAATTQRERGLKARGVLRGGNPDAGAVPGRVPEMTWRYEP